MSNPVRVLALVFAAEMRIPLILGVALVGLGGVSVTLWSLWSRRCTANNNTVGRVGKRMKGGGEGRVSILILLGMMPPLCKGTRSG